MIEQGFRPDVIHVTRAPFFKNGTVQPQLGTGGMEVAVGLGARSLHDAALTLRPGMPSERPWEEHFIDKRDVPELGIQTDEQRIHLIMEQIVDPDKFKGFREWSGAMWWLHHGMEDQFVTDAQSWGLSENFTDSHSAFGKINGAVARQIKALPHQPEAIVVQDPYYFPRVASMLKQQLGYGQETELIGVNHIPFPTPENFTMLRHITPHWEKLARAYMKNWMEFDTISVHTDEDAERFRASAARYYPEGNLPKLVVNPLGIDGEMIEQVTHKISEKDRDELEKLILSNAPHLTSFDQLDSLVIGASIGYRSDPIKQIPLNLTSIHVLLKRNPKLRGKLTYVQQIRPHRIDDYASYRQEYDHVTQVAQAINDEYATDGWQPIILINQEFPHEDVLKMQKLLAEKALRYYTSIPSIEGMNLAGQEAVFASGRPDTGLIVSTGSGLGKTLEARGADDLVIPTSHPTSEQIAHYVEMFLGMSHDEVITANQRTKDVLTQLNPETWLNNLSSRMMSPQTTQVYPSAI